MRTAEADATEPRDKLDETSVLQAAPRQLNYSSTTRVAPRLTRAPTCKIVEQSLITSHFHHTNASHAGAALMDNSSSPRLSDPGACSAKLTSSTAAARLRNWLTPTWLAQLITVANQRRPPGRNDSVETNLIATILTHLHLTDLASAAGVLCDQRQNVDRRHTREDTSSDALPPAKSLSSWGGGSADLSPRCASARPLARLPYPPPSLAQRMLIYYEWRVLWNAL